MSHSTDKKPQKVCKHLIIKKHQAQEIFNHITSEFSHLPSSMSIPQFEKPWFKGCGQSYANPALKLRDPLQA